MATMLSTIYKRFTPINFIFFQNEPYNFQDSRVSGANAATCPHVYNVAITDCTKLRGMGLGFPS